MDDDPDESEMEEDYDIGDDMDDEDSEFDSDEYDDDQAVNDFGAGLIHATRRYEAESAEIMPQLLEQLYALRLAAGDFNEDEFKRVSRRLRSHVVHDILFFTYKANMANGQVRVEKGHHSEWDDDEDFASLLYHVCNLGCDYDTIWTVHELNAQADEVEVEAAVRGNCDFATMDLLLIRSEECFPKGFFIRDSVPEDSAVGFDFEMQDLARQITTTTTIQEVCLVHDEIKDVDLNDLIIALSGQHQLTRLTIHGCFLTACMAVPIPSIGQLIHLVHLELSVRTFGPTIAGPLSELVKTTTALTHLNLQYNDIGLEGMCLIYDALRFNTSIQDLTLDHKEPLVGMINVFEHNSTLRNIFCFGQAEQLRSWLQANYVGRRALFDEHCSKKTFVDLLCSLKRESLNEWYDRSGGRSRDVWRVRAHTTDFQSVLYVLLRTRPDVWSK